MKQRSRSLRIALAALLFSTAMGFGVFQVAADSGVSAQPQEGSCDAWACRTECQGFGGDLGPGGPGQGLVCYCCG